MIDWVGLCTSDFFPAAAHTVDAMAKWPGSQEPTQTGFSVAWNIDVPMFVEIGKNPARAKRFGGAMQSLTGGEGYEVDYLVDGYPWGEIEQGVMVDVSRTLPIIAMPANGYLPPRLAARTASFPSPLPKSSPAGSS